MKLWLWYGDSLLLFSCEVISDSLRVHGLQPAKLLSPSVISWSLLKFMSIELVTLSHHLIVCHFVFLLPLIFPIIRVFSGESALLHQVAKVLELQHQPFQ